MENGKTRHGSLQIMLETYTPGKGYIGLYENLKRQILNSKAKDTVSVRKKQYQLQALERFFTLLKDHENLQNLPGREIIKRYGDLIFGDGKKYDVSELIDPNLITQEYGRKHILYAKLDNGKRRKISVPISEKEALSIEEIGILAYHNSNKENERLMQYAIKRNNDFGEEVKNKVFSNIDLKRIAVDEAYREAVLELLGDNNIELSNAAGYIGIIAPRRPGDLAVGKSNAKNMKQDGALIYNVNSKYVLVKAADQATASYIFYREPELYTDKDEKKGPDLLWNGER